MCDPWAVHYVGLAVYIPVGRIMKLRQAAQQALDYIVATNKSSRFLLVPASNLNKTITALRAALAEPQTTHWEGCEAVHPECKVTPHKPLTDEEIWKCLPPDPDELAFARAIERKHGIGEQT